ncbi:hypothetical protein [Sphingobacterium chungjuense]|uniref:hypothetical protein n=1 Tax=Sphingobacterium chungjuense TaxID=2675553 RepID=UPI001407F47D|nr:hypothetical protein [Sphingobacterium chungjuense]
MTRETQSINTTRTDNAEHNGYQITFSIVVATNTLDNITVMAYKNGNYAFNINKNYVNPNLSMSFANGVFDFATANDVINELDVIVAELTERPTQH